ncbi:unnamed protein product [Urochloa humidicola]
MASSSNTLKVLACAVLLMSTIVSLGRCESEHSRAAAAPVIITGRKMLVEEVTVTAVGVPRLTRAAAAAAYSESKRSSPSGPDPQHH